MYVVYHTELCGQKMQYVESPRTMQWSISPVTVTEKHDGATTASCSLSILALTFRPLENAFAEDVVDGSVSENAFAGEHVTTDSGKQLSIPDVSELEQ